MAMRTVPLDDAGARKIASEWRGGEGCPIAKFAETGAIVPGLAGELEAQIEHTSDLALGLRPTGAVAGSDHSNALLAECVRLRALLAYVQAQSNEED